VITLPTAPHDTTPVAFSTLNLDPRLARAIAEYGFATTTPVQSAVYPTVLAGTDLVGCAQTGTGKTIAFLLPVLQRLLGQAGQVRAQHGRVTRLLVLAPTRELAAQIEEDARTLTKHAPLATVAVYGGVGTTPQARALRAGIDIVVATPGRLLDHIRAGAARFTHLDTLVLDEADRMLDMGFWPDVMRIVAALPTTRQTLLFSATTSADVMKAAARIMRDPQVIQVGRTGGLATTITHVRHEMTHDQKLAWLTRFLTRTGGKALVFVRTKHRADRLVRRLETSQIRCAALHANRSQNQRAAAVEGFGSGRVDVLVATDIAARGLDIEQVAHVINFEVPQTPDAYVHRVGRTGRAEATGTAITLVDPEERGTMRTIERTLNLLMEERLA